MIQEIKYLLKCKDVERLSQYYHHRQYNLMEHQYLVGMMFMAFAKEENIEYDITVLQLVMKHDLLETISMDLSYEVKNLSFKTQEAWDVIENEVASCNPVLDKYTDVNIESGMNQEQFKLFKACDLLDLLLFLYSEESIGNNGVKIQILINRCQELIKGKFESIDNFLINFSL